MTVEGYDDYRSVRFTVDRDALNKNVKVVIGIGDSLGYIDRKAVIINRSPVAAEVAVSESNIMSLAEDDKLTENNVTVNESGTAVTLAIGIDTSADMQKFDPGATKVWMDSIEGLIESANTGVETVLVTNDNFGYTKDAESAKASLDLIKTNEYSGSTDSLTLLERCDEALSDAENISQSENKAAVLFVQNIGDISKLKAKKEELENKGTAVYIMALTNEDIDVSDDENIYVCKTELELRLKVSELYAAFGGIAEAMTTAESSRAVEVYTSDFKVGKHNFVGIDGNAFGASIASVLNIYGCLPAYTNDYSLFDKLNDVYNLTQCNASKVSSDNASKIAEFYQSMMESYSSDSNITLAEEDISASDIQQVIDQNLKYRFPVVTYNNNGAYVITSKNSSGNYCVNGTQETIEGTYKVIDTYSYLLQIANTTNIVDKTDYASRFYDSIKFTVPYRCKISDIAYATYSGSGELTLSIENNTAVFSGVTDGSKYLAGVKTVYDGTIPNVYNSTKYYNVIQYDDENKRQEWYHPYLFKATNLGIINGDQQPDGSLPFNAENPVTRAQFLKMLLVSAGIEKDANSEGYWAEKYIRKAINLGMIRAEYNGSSLNEAFYDAGIQRCEAAYSLSRLYIYQADKVNVPSNLYLYNYDVSSQRNSAWKNGQAFTEQVFFEDQINSKLETLTNAGAKKYVDAIYQMYLNGIMVGNENHEFGTLNTLTRAEASKILVMSLFTLDEGLQNVQVVKEGEKTVYIVLYDSLYGENQILPENQALAPRYLNESGNRFKYEGQSEYSTEFFKNYLKLIKDVNVKFAISIRETDFDRYIDDKKAVTEDPVITTNYPLKPEEVASSSRETNWLKIKNDTATRISDIIKNMKNAYNELEENEKPSALPQVYIGTPHFDGTLITGNEIDTYTNSYLQMTKAIYEDVLSTAGINENNIAGIYFGREDPDDVGDTNNTSWQCKKALAEYAHSLGKQVIWMPYTVGNIDSMRKIAGVVNNGYVDENGKIQNLCDVVVIQPGYFYYEVSPGNGHNGYQTLMSDYIKPSVVNQVMCYNDLSGNKISNPSKYTTTKICFQMEYDMSLVTGRMKTISALPGKKAARLLYTANQFNDLIYDTSTSFGIYSGGPSEQNYDSLGDNNEKYHSNRNHIAGDEDFSDPRLGYRKYSEFSLTMTAANTATLAEGGNTVSGTIIYDITDILLDKNGNGRLDTYLRNIYGAVVDNPNVVQ